MFKLRARIHKVVRMHSVDLVHDWRNARRESDERVSEGSHWY